MVMVVPPPQQIIAEFTNQQLRWINRKARHNEFHGRAFDLAQAIVKFAFYQIRILYWHDGTDRGLRGRYP